MATKFSKIPVRDLDQLIEVAKQFKKLALVTPNGFTRGQLSGWRWLETAFYHPDIQEECRSLDAEGQARVDRLLTSVENILSPEGRKVLAG